MLSVNSPPRVCYCALVSFWHFFLIPVGQFLILLGQLPTPSSLFLVWDRLWDTQTWIVYYLRRPLTCGSVLIFEPPISRGKPGCLSACRMAPTTPPGWPRGAGGSRPVALCPFAGWGSTGGWPRRGAVGNMGNDGMRSKQDHWKASVLFIGSVGHLAIDDVYTLKCAVLVAR
jgi:hypothetical protein